MKLKIKGQLLQEPEYRFQSKKCFFRILDENYIFCSRASQVCVRKLVPVPGTVKATLVVWATTPQQVTMSHPTIDDRETTYRARRVRGDTESTSQAAHATTTSRPGLGLLKSYVDARRIHRLRHGMTRSPQI